MPRQPPKDKNCKSSKLTIEINANNEDIAKVRILAIMAMANYMNRFPPNKKLIKVFNKTIKAL